MGRSKEKQSQCTFIKRYIAFSSKLRVASLVNIHAEFTLNPISICETSHLFVFYFVRAFVHEQDTKL